ncbi:MAG: hypothetical protein AAGB26_08770 [Planctomycetota bacterium]
MKRSMFPVLLAVLLCASPMLAEAEPDVDQAVLKTIDTYIAAMREGDYDTMAELMHPDDLAQFKKLFVLIAMEAKEQDAFDELALFLGGIKDPRELEETEAEKFFAQFMSAVVQFVPDVGALLKTAEVTILGKVTEGENNELLHIVHRMEMEVEGEPVSTIDVISMRRSGGGSYRLILDEMAWGVTRSLQKRFGIKRDVGLD